MEIDQILGLPAHPLLVHGVVALIPLCAVGVILTALWPAARDRLAVPVLVLTASSVTLVPFVTESGEWLEERVRETALVERHAELGDAFLPFAIALLVGAAAAYETYLVGHSGAKSVWSKVVKKGERLGEGSVVRKESKGEIDVESIQGI